MNFHHHVYWFQSRTILIRCAQTIERSTIFQKTDSFPIPRIDDCIDKVGNARYVRKFDLLKGFWQIPLTERAKEASAFVTPDGLFQNKVASPGENKICTVVIVMRHFYVCIDCLPY